ncbi:LLM class F420-dependent oxidoreductase [Ktedonosporobacter rubrisoli]|uniref:LLM class F420-dependent oxidoreductase n=1 Tax=Ktedonosporobacter rubrisoli TaxID=2509675 RepID=A0A4P6JRQ8_KTERU|nr:LLM class F420-dependent oxidoreductase [Ktedonosporobacter rubrisoli]QBD78159.1 LLM class F420-dependent oxidoreductase [Ktedonosporobacter rubrisoli]
MRIGLQVPSFTWSNEQETLGDTFALIAERAERAGFFSLWVMDHFFQIPVIGPVEHEMLEGYSALAFAAGRTNRIKLGTLVTGVTYRYPGILIKTVTTLDVLSHGRAYFGIGAAWNEEEHAGLGVPFPPLAERFERLEETLQIAHQMWAGDEKPYQGKHYQLARPLNAPSSVQKPHPPIMIGGMGERKTLRLVAQYGDACNFSLMRLKQGELAHKLNVLREHCQAVGRPYSDIEKTTLGPIKLTRDGRDNSFTPAAAIAYFRNLAEQGIDQALVNMPNVADLEPFELFANEVIPAVEQIEVAGR